MIYNHHWDLTTIPDDKFASERGRRNQAKRGSTAKLSPCVGCATSLTARQRRAACPECGKMQPWKDVYAYRAS